MLSSKHNLIRIIGASFIMIIFTLAAKPAQAIWYDESWQYRQTINITNGSSSALTNYQVPVVINTAGLIAAGKLQNDCDDLRFTDVAQASLPYWIDSETGPGCNSATTKIWVKVPVIPPSGASVLYVYYANSSAVAATSYPNTMAWGEIGAATAGATWRQISLLQSYSNPVIVSTYQEGANGPAGTDLPVSVRLKDVTSNNFKVTLQNAALVPATPATDLIYYLVINQGQYKLLGAGDLRLDGNNLTTNKVGSWSGGAAGWAAGKAESQIISPVFSAGALDPMTVLHQVMSYNDSSWIETWVSETDDYDDPVRPGGFQISLNGAEVRNTHGAEQIGWIGINPGASATAGLLKFETKLTSNVITGHDDAVVTQNFARTTYTTPPLVIYKQQEMNSTDGGWAVITNVTTAAVTGHIEEDKRLDPERSHPGEIVGFLAVSAPGKFTLRKFAAEEPVLSAPQNEEIGLSPVGYWPLDDGAGPTVDDQSAGNYDGTIIGATWADAQECQVGQCLSFDGTGDYINVPHVAALNGNSALTYELWFNARTFTKTHNQLIGKSIHDGGTGRSQMGIWLDNAGKLTGRAQLVAASSTINYATSVPPNSWHQAALVFSGTALNLYLDGEEVASSTFGLNSLVSTIDPLRFGCDYERCGAPDPDYLFDGWLDEIRIYNYARSTGQIESDYLLGLMPGNLTLGAPQNVRNLAGSFYNTTDSITFQWDAVPGADAYFVYVRTPYDPPTYDYIGLTNTISFILTTNDPLNGAPPLKADTSYGIKVIAYDMSSGSFGTMSEEGSAATSANVPANLISSTTISEIEWQWDSGGRESGFYAQVEEDPEHNSGWLPWRFSDGAFSPKFGFRSLSEVSAGISAYDGVLVTGRDRLEYSRGSQINKNLYENFAPQQGTLEFWVKPQWIGTDREDHYIFNAYGNDKNYLSLRKTADDDEWRMEVKYNNINSSAAVASVPIINGSWYYLVGVWDINRALEGGGDYVRLYVNSADSIASPQQPGTPSVIPSTFGLGQFAGESQFNGTIAGRILNYPLTSVQVANLYNAGSGREQTFAVEPDTVWLADASGDSTDAVFWPRGQAVLSTTGNLVTTAETLSKRVWRNNERVWISDGTGFGRAAFISATPVASAFSIAVDDGSGLPVTDLENVGRSLNFGGIGYVGLGNFGLFEMSTGDLSMDIWVKTEETGKQAIFNKGGGTNSIPGYGLGLSSGGILTSQLSSGTARQEITGVAPVADGRWHHLAVVWDRSGFTNLYLDGQLDKTAATSFNGTGIVNSAQNLIIGKNSHENTAFFSGQVAAARLYHVAITSAEVKWLAEHPQVSTSEVEAAVNSITKVYTSTTGPVTAGTLVDVPVLSAVGLAAGQTVWLKDSATAQSENAILAAVSLGQVTVAVLNNDYAANSQLSYSDLVSYSAFYNGDAGDLSIYQNDGAVVAASYTQSAFISKNLLSDVGMENGGIGGWNGVDTELSKNINLARNDEQCLQIKSTGGTPSYAASELIAVAPLTDYCLTGWQRAGADSFARIEVYDSAETFPPIWSSSANSVASWNFVNGCFTVPLAESGLVVRLSTGADSADLAYYDQFEILPQLIKNPGLGDLDSGNVPDGWTKNSTPTLIKEVGGGHSVGDAVSISGSADSTKSLSQTVNYTLGQRYTFNFWVKRLAGAGKPLVDLGGLADSWQGGSTRVYPENMINGTWYLWTFTSWPLQAPTDRTISLAVNNAATKIVYDDVSVTELDVVTPATNTPGSYQHSLGTGHYNDERGAFLIDGADKLMYPTNGRIIGDKGTVLFWVKPQFLNSSRKLFSVYTDSNDYFSVGIGADNKSYADLNGTVMAIGDTPFSTVDQWYHLAVTWQYGVDLTLYVNNVDEDSYSNSATLSLPTNLELGSENSILQADSFLDDVYLFREVITLDDIETIYGSSQTLNWRKWKTRDLSCGVNYTGQVKAVNRDGDETEWIQALSVTAPCPTYCVDADDCSVGFICLYDVCVPENKCEPH
ncbi:MAG: hypothetical protein A2445_04375 [Candidatus Jacksonbacteria bacterium RIFOXYC2_FULL_44_29]|nr:MAG: hypothetical protein A2240_04790 [Candidatus Jacksonbacteria bacterium RIFOXYA2_FULL_43_12]OGY77622.1 MAG: hypothetical protein A2445_04375 [Candidatus Jacksonbacteria bacterium RIFOXYC2_FULL_44_29]OGY80288.1 MAG: hypothetical protein A2550_04030 [Candidatus Jacksonbacteria bacterium RIFOXYD2_FULL_43_21]HBH46539.1 hypothetical protein [Candidatus Jacksonbacteria bacterium]HCE48693.1 hypothetical protein [Candidatus Jacksonbacteria bacterium]